MLDSKLGFGMVCAAGVAIGVTTALWLHGTAAPPAAPAPAVASAWDGAIGPGGLAEPAPGRGGAFGTAESGEPPLTDAGGRLVIGLPLRQLIDSYVLKDRAAELRTYLRYLEAERQARAQVRMAPLGEAALDSAQVEQLQAWQRQRLRRRDAGGAHAQGGSVPYETVMVHLLRPYPHVS